MVVTGDLEILLKNVDTPQAGGSVVLIFSRFLIGVTGMQSTTAQQYRWEELTW